LVAVDAATMSSTCAERTYSISDQLIAMQDPTPAAVTVNVMSTAGYTATVQNNIQHDTATAFYQRNLCLTIPGYNPTTVLIPSPGTGLRIFPNPTSGIIRIETTEPASVAEVYSLIGAKVLAADVSLSKSLDCSSLSPGNYLIRVSCTSGHIIRQKFCKQ
jgi:hypothetical protein